jgi:hypothetical protein
VARLTDPRIGPSRRVWCGVIAARLISSRQPRRACGDQLPTSKELKCIASEGPASRATERVPVHPVLFSQFVSFRFDPFRFSHP